MRIVRFRLSGIYDFCDVGVGDMIKVIGEFCIIKMVFTLAGEVQEISESGILIRDYKDHAGVYLEFSEFHPLAIEETRERVIFHYH